MVRIEANCAFACVTVRPATSISAGSRGGTLAHMNHREARRRFSRGGTRQHAPPAIGW